MDHSYEEIRSAALSILSGKAGGTNGGPHQYEMLRKAVAEFLTSSRGAPAPGAGRAAVLSQTDSDLFMEVFWDLFRQGLITLGYNDANREFPFFRLTQFGRRALSQEHASFYYDTADYDDAISREAPEADDVTRRCLNEAMAAYKAGCMMSSVMMLSLSVEHVLVQLIEAIERGPALREYFDWVFDADAPSAKLAALQESIARQPNVLPPALRHGLDAELSGAASLLRMARDERGRPALDAPNREQVYMLLRAVLSQLNTLNNLRDHFSAAPVLIATRSAHGHKQATA